MDFFRKLGLALIFLLIATACDAVDSSGLDDGEDSALAFVSEVVEETSTDAEGADEDDPLGDTDSDDSEQSDDADADDDGSDSLADTEDDADDDDDTLDSTDEDDSGNNIAAGEVVETTTTTAAPTTAAPTTTCLLYTSPSPRDQRGSRMPSSA